MPILAEIYQKTFSGGYSLKISPRNWPTRCYVNWISSIASSSTCFFFSKNSVYFLRFRCSCLLLRVFVYHCGFCFVLFVCYFFQRMIMCLFVYMFVCLFSLCPIDQASSHCFILKDKWRDADTCTQDSEWTTNGRYQKKMCAERVGLLIRNIFLM